MAVDDKELEEIVRLAEEVLAQYEYDFPIPRPTVNRAGGPTPEWMRRMIPGGVPEGPAAARSSGEPSSSGSGIRTSRAPSAEREQVPERPVSSIGLEPMEIAPLDVRVPEKQPNTDNEDERFTVKCPSCQHSNQVSSILFAVGSLESVLIGCNCDARPSGCECTFHGIFDQYLAPGDVEERPHDQQMPEGVHDEHREMAMPEEVESKKEQSMAMPRRARKRWLGRPAEYHQMELRNPHDGASGSSDVQQEPRGEAMELHPYAPSDVQLEPRGRPGRGDAIEEEHLRRAMQISMEEEAARKQSEEEATGRKRKRN